VAYWQAWAITVPTAVLLAWLITRFVEKPLMPRLKALLVSAQQRLTRRSPVAAGELAP
jgi:peptidoglycan/LPS O-acetylase OafA/YrhL